MTGLNAASPILARLHPHAPMTATLELGDLTLEIEGRCRFATVETAPSGEEVLLIGVDGLTWNDDVAYVTVPVSSLPAVAPTKGRLKLTVVRGPARMVLCVGEGSGDDEGAGSDGGLGEPRVARHLAAVPDRSPGERLPGGSSASSRSEPAPPRCLDALAQREVVELVEEIPWGDTQGSMRDIELGLAMLLEATADAYQGWPPLEESLSVDEWMVDADMRARFSTEETLAWLAQMIRDIAMNFGGAWGPISSDSSGPGAVTQRIDEVVMRSIRRRDDA